MGNKVVLYQITLSELLGEITKAVRSELDARTPHATPPPEELLTRVEAAQLLGITLPTLREYTRKGYVTGYRIGTRVRYKRSEVMDSLQRTHSKKSASNKRNLDAEPPMKNHGDHNVIANTNRSLSDYDLSLRLLNALAIANVFTIGDLVKTTKAVLFSSRNFGARSWAELNDFMDSHGICLLEDQHDNP